MMWARRYESTRSGARTHTQRRPFVKGARILLQRGAVHAAALLVGCVHHAGYGIGGPGEVRMSTASSSVGRVSQVWTWVIGRLSRAAARRRSGENILPGRIEESIGFRVRAA